MENDESVSQTRDLAVQKVKNDFESGARKLADIALEELHKIAVHAARSTNSWKYYWITIHDAAKDICLARPSMGASITTCLVGALQQVSLAWDRGEDENGPTNLQELTEDTFGRVKRERELTTKKLNSTFTRYIHDRIENQSSIWARSSAAQTIHKFRILTLSNSGTIRSAVLFALEQLPYLTIDLYIMESRPRFEGADMAAQLKQSEFGHRIHISVIPDVAVCSIVERGMDIALLGADCISAEGNVSNKIGSKSLAASVQIFDERKEASVIVLSDVDKIAAPDRHNDPHSAEQHPKAELTAAWSNIAQEHASEFDTFNEWFEWVPARFIHLYITDQGILDLAGVQGHSKDIGELTDMIFSDNDRETSPEDYIKEEPMD